MKEPKRYTYKSFGQGMTQENFLLCQQPNYVLYKDFQDAVEEARKHGQSEGAKAAFDALDHKFERTFLNAVDARKVTSNL